MERDPNPAGQRTSCLEIPMGHDLEHDSPFACNLWEHAGLLPNDFQTTWKSLGFSWIEQDKFQHFFSET